MKANADETKSRLCDFLSSEFARRGGAMPFEDYMALALYDPEFGYYTANIPGVGGRNADFATTNTMGSATGLAIARWIRGMEKTPPVLVEAGAGDGSLARVVLSSLGFRTRRRLGYRIVEISPKLRESQRQALRKFRNRVQWFDSMAEALDDLADPVVFSNELVDAFPARWLRFSGEAWEEVWVRFDPSRGISEEFRPLESQPAVPAGLGIENQRIEIHRSYRRWLESWMPRLKSGRLLTIDYGGTPDEIYHRRPGGTLRGYFRHQRFGGGEIYQRFGRQDLTADVNFEDLVRWGGEFGFERELYETQGEFLRRFRTGREAGETLPALEEFRVLLQVKRH